MILCYCRILKSRQGRVLVRGLRCLSLLCRNEGRGFPGSDSLVVICPRRRDCFYQCRIDRCGLCATQSRSCRLPTPRGAHTRCCAVRVICILRRGPQPQRPEGPEYIKRDHVFQIADLCLAVSVQTSERRSGRSARGERCPDERLFCQVR